MKKIFLSAVSLFVVSFLGFVITRAMLGRRHYSDNSYVEEASYKTQIFGGDYTASDSWTVLNNFPYVNINSAGVKTVIGRSDSDRITVSLNNASNKTVHVEAVYTGDELTIEARPTNITFDVNNIKFGITSWLEDIFSGNSDVTLMIGFPEVIFEQINIQQGSGTMQINDLYSHRYDVKIGSGKCEFSRSSEGGFVSGRFDLDLGSGSAVFSGMESEYYTLDIGSGKFNLNKLSGEGYINMGSGSGEICYVDNECDHEIEMGTGNLVLYFPKDSGFTVEDCDIGSGKVEIDAYGAKETINNSNCDEIDKIGVGTGVSKLDIDMGSGYVGLRDSDAYTAPEIISEYKAIQTAEIDGNSISSGFGSVSSSVEAVTGVVITSGTEEISSSEESGAVTISDESSDSSQSDVEQSDSSQSAAAQSDSSQSAATQSDSSQLDVAQSDSSQSDVSQSDI